MEQVSIIGLDLAKNVFQVHGVTAAGKCTFRSIRSLVPTTSGQAFRSIRSR